MIEKAYNIKSKPCECQDCLATKSMKAQMGQGSSERAQLPLELVHIDLATHFSTKMEFTCLLVAMDNTSSFTYVKPLHTKSNALQVLKEWITYAETQTSHRLRTLQSDNGTKWTSAATTAWQNKAGFCWQKTSAYNSEQNSKAERAIRTIKNMMMVMMQMHSLPQTFWPFAAEAVAFTKNVMPNVENQIPYQIFYNKDPQTPSKLLQTFGHLTWVHIPKAKRRKLNDTTIPTIFVRYDKEHKGWKFISQHHNPSIFWSNTARFMENKSWNDCTDTLPIQDDEEMQYNDLADIEHMGYTNEDIHNKQLRQPIGDIYQPPEDQDPQLEGDYHTHETGQAPSSPNNGE
ncbi:uncharacterized protein UBRO_20001 [Ustilago bromivora]|uniref:Integrase catalytic domain-containing protein n=1 Tax=Ustilago bromivora TaxID=307758 RepID=A0A1K0HE62_9BASI|nr:uncharacterized protein UBRO_20001 [Ustilago bromivora]